MPHRLFSFAPQSFCLALAGLAILALAPAGCRKEEDNTIARVANIDGPDVRLDARGSSVDSAAVTGGAASDGSGGTAGDIRVTSSGGTVTVTSASRTFVVPTLTFTGNGVTVRSGERRNMFGAQRAHDFLDVQPGGEVVLMENSVLEVAGNVRIAGTLRSAARTGVIRQDGHSIHLTSCGGTVVITGTINCSGANSRPLSAGERSELIDPRADITLGGNGGDVSISAAMDIVVTGSVIAKGGSTESQDPSKSDAGRGGRIILTAGRNFLSSGAFIARAGNGVTNSGQGIRGGDIQLSALGDVLLQEVDRINASGGRSSGTTPGSGGSVTIAASVGNTTIEGFDVLVAGAPITGLGGFGGTGGSASFSGSNLLLRTMKIDASGGDVVAGEEIKADSPTGPGGTAGTVTFLGGNSVTVASDVAIDLQGGESRGIGITAGGPGGTFQAASPVSNSVDIAGTVNIRGGNNFGGQEGDPGTACLSGATPESKKAVIGSNDFTSVEECGSSVSFGGVVFDLDCAITTTDTTQIGAQSAKFYQVSVDSTTTSVTISTTGEIGGNLDLFVGGAAALGDPNPASYAFTSAGPSSTETITIDDTTFPNLATLASGGFLSVMVVEGQIGGACIIAETLTITVACQ